MYARYWVTMNYVTTARSNVFPTQFYDPTHVNEILSTINGIGMFME